jgi:hypothetical protein
MHWYVKRRHKNKIDQFAIFMMTSVALNAGIGSRVCVQDEENGSSCTVERMQEGELEKVMMVCCCCC